MAKYLAQLIVTGASIVGRAFARAVQQEIRTSQQAAKARHGKEGSSGGAKQAATDALTGMTIQEAKQILNIENIEDVEKLKQNFDHLFSVNEKAKGGSFYLQSKIVRAKERLDQNINEQQTAESQTSAKHPPDQPAGKS